MFLLLFLPIFRMQCFQCDWLRFRFSLSDNCISLWSPSIQGKRACIIPLNWVKVLLVIWLLQSGMDSDYLLHKTFSDCWYFQMPLKNSLAHNPPVPYHCCPSSHFLQFSCNYWYCVPYNCLNYCFNYYFWSKKSEMPRAREKLVKKMKSCNER